MKIAIPCFFNASDDAMNVIDRWSAHFFTAVCLIFITINTWIFTKKRVPVWNITASIKSQFRETLTILFNEFLYYLLFVHIVTVNNISSSSVSPWLNIYGRFFLQITIYLQKSALKFNDFLRFEFKTIYFLAGIVRFFNSAILRF